MFLQDILFNFVAEMLLTVCVLFWQQLNMLASVSTPAPPSIQGGLQQLQPGPLESQTFAASGGTRQRREIPQVYILIAVFCAP
jgi:hypothetical protein